MAGAGFYVTGLAVAQGYVLELDGGCGDHGEGLLAALFEIVEVEGVDEVGEGGEARLFLFGERRGLGVLRLRLELAGLGVEDDACLLEHLFVGEDWDGYPDRQRQGVAGAGVDLDAL